MKRTLSICAVAALLASMLAGCGSSMKTGAGQVAVPPTAMSGPVEGGTIRLAFGADLPHLDPAQPTDTQSIQFVQLMYEPLLTYSPTSTKLIGGLADKWTWSNGNKTLQVHLNPQATFASGTKVRADDVIYSFTHLLDPQTKAGYASFFAGIKGTQDFQAGKAPTVAGLTKVDDSTVQFELDAPAVWFLNALALPCASIQEQKAVAGKGDAFYDSASAGSGPYTLKSWTKGQSAVLVANALYWRKGEIIDGVKEGPFIQEIQAAMKVDQTNEFLQFQKGSLDFASVAPATYLAVQQDEHLKQQYFHNPSVAIWYLGFNTELAPFDNPKVREAFNYAVDKAATLKAYNNRGELAEGLLPPGMPGYDASLKPLARDIAKAKQLLQDAKFDPNQTVTLYLPDRDSFKKLGAVVQQNLQEAGIKVELKTEAWDVFLTDTSTPKKAQMFLLDWVQDYPDPQDFVYALFNSASAVDQGTNAFFYKNPQVDQLEAKADADTNEQSRLATYQEIQRIIDKDYPWVPLFYPWDNVMKSPQVQASDNALFLHPVLQTQIDKLWLQR